MLVAGVLLLAVGIFFRENKKPTRIGQQLLNTEEVILKYYGFTYQSRKIITLRYSIQQQMHTIPEFPGYFFVPPARFLKAGTTSERVRS